MEELDLSQAILQELTNQIAQLSIDRAIWKARAEAAEAQLQEKSTSGKTTKPK